VGPKVSFSPNKLSFGNQAVATPSTALNERLSNTGPGELEISGIGVSTNFTQTNNCPDILRSGAQCMIAVSFSPATSGSISGTLTVTDNAKGSPQAVSLNGTGVLQATLSPSSLSFNKIAVGATTNAKPLTLTNNLNTPLSIANIVATTNFTQSNNCGTALPALGSCTVNVSFAPQTTNSLTGTLTVTDTASNSPQVTRLSGTGK
jgi:hypothetical protein